MNRKNKKVVVGVSGGVDSSVALTLLKEKGFSPIALFINFQEENNRCCGSEARRRAGETCQELNIPFYEINAEERFKERVIEYFLDSYKEGKTPNPCVVCNKQVKFKVLFDKLKDFNASYIATGHYARIDEGKIFVAEDEKKDQSYFLWDLSKEVLRKMIFPLGKLTKTEVRKRAREFDLPTAETAESQEVCFVESDLESFLRGRISLVPGDIKDKTGKKLGTHVGLPVYTIGQRRGIGLSGGPYYVLRKDTDRNVLVVTKDRKDLEERRVSFERANFFEKPDLPLPVEAKIRYNAPKGKGILKEDLFLFDEPRRAITPGQSIVFYKGEKLLGGAVIK